MKYFTRFKKINFFTILLIITIGLGFVLPFKNIEARKNVISEESAVKFQKNNQKLTEKEATLDQRKIILNKALDLTVKHLDKTKEKIEKMPNLPDALKAQLIEKINLRIQEFNNLKSEVNKVKTLNEIKVLTQNIKLKIREVKKQIIKDVVERIKNHRLMMLIGRIEKIIEKLTAKGNELKKSGIDVSNIENMFLSIKSETNALKEKISVGKYNEAVNSANTVRQGLKIILTELNKALKNRK